MQAQYENIQKSLVDQNKQTTFLKPKDNEKLQRVKRHANKSVQNILSIPDQAKTSSGYRPSEQPFKSMQVRKNKQDLLASMNDSLRQQSMHVKNGKSEVFDKIRFQKKKRSNTNNVNTRSNTKTSRSNSRSSIATKSNKSNSNVKKRFKNSKKRRVIVTKPSKSLDG